MVPGEVLGRFGDVLSFKEQIKKALDAMQWSSGEVLCVSGGPR